MLTRAIDLAFNVSHALQIFPPDYVRSILGNPDTWQTRTCPPTELQLGAPGEWSKGLPALAHILIPALPRKLSGVNIPFADLWFRPSEVYCYPSGAKRGNPTPREMWFFINGICTDRSVADLNAEYLHGLFGRPLTVLHNFTRGFIPDLAACAVGKEWDQVTESAAVAFPHVYAALKNAACERVILLGHSQGTILSAVILELLKGLHPPVRERWVKAPVVSPEHSVARKLAGRWDFARSMRPPRAGKKGAGPSAPLAFKCPGHRPRQPEPVTLAELRKLELYCFANCATEMLPIRGGRGVPAPWIESYGNEKDLVARLGVLANASGPGSVRIGGDRYRRDAAWGHLLNAHYLYPMMRALEMGKEDGGLVPVGSNRFPAPRLFDYLDKKSPPPLHRPIATGGPRVARGQ
jgi:hypothetical protein